MVAAMHFFFFSKNVTCFVKVVFFYPAVFCVAVLHKGRFSFHQSASGSSALEKRFHFQFEMLTDLRAKKLLVRS